MVCVSSEWRWLPMHSIACFFGLLFLVIFALIAFPILILVVKLAGLLFVGGAIALIVLGIWQLFVLAGTQYRPYSSRAVAPHGASIEVAEKMHDGCRSEFGVACAEPLRFYAAE